MTKAEIIDAVYEKVGGFSKKESAEIVEAVFDTMKEVLADGKKIKISGFGNFVVRAKKQPCLKVSENRLLTKEKADLPVLHLRQKAGLSQCIRP